MSNTFAVGDFVKVVNDQCADYGRWLGMTGVVVARGALIRGNRRYRVDFGTVEIYAFEPDLAPGEV